MYFILASTNHREINSEGVESRCICDVARVYVREEFIVSVRCLYGTAGLMAAA